MGLLFADLRYGARRLLREPGFTLVALLTLALGIGANTAIFSVVNSVLLKPLPYKDPSRLVALSSYRKGKLGQISPANFLDWRQQSQAFEQLAAIFVRHGNLSSGGEPERVPLAITSANFFELLGARPAAGRLFEPADEAAGHPSILVISHGLWQRRFGGDLGIVGQAVTLDGKSATVVGIAPPGFDYPNGTELWFPPSRIVPELGENIGDVTGIRGLGYLSAIGRLADGLDVSRAQVEMDSISTALEQQYPDANQGVRVRVATLQDQLVGNVKPALLVLLGAVGCVLLIACVNVANMHLARATARRKEIAIRYALGAARLRIMRQLLVESVLLSLTGGVVGLLMAMWGVDLLLGLSPDYVPRAAEVEVDRWVLTFTFAVSVLTGIGFGLFPAVAGSRIDLTGALKEGTRGGIGARNRLRSTLVAVEVALSVVLLSGAGLLLRSFILLQQVNPGFDPAHTLTFKIAPSGPNYDDARRAAFYNGILARIQSLPGVESAGAANTLPLQLGPFYRFAIRGRPPAPPGTEPAANFRLISSDYFRSMGMRLISGRPLTNDDKEGAKDAIVINQALARREFADEDPVGKELNFGTRNGQPIWYEVVGVVADFRNEDLKASARPEVYAHHQQYSVPQMAFVVHSSRDPINLIAGIRSVVSSVDSSQPLADMKTMDQIVAGASMQERLNLLLLGVFALVALLLAAAGVYGMTSYSVAQRTAEVGVRIALGARPRDVLRLVLFDGMKMALWGIACGLLPALLLTRLMSRLLYAVAPNDPPTFVIVPLILALVAVLACYVPARRATKVEPMIALRAE